MTTATTMRTPGGSVRRAWVVAIILTVLVGIAAFGIPPRPAGAWARTATDLNPAQAALPFDLAITSACRTFDGQDVTVTVRNVGGIQNLGTAFTFDTAWHYRSDDFGQFDEVASTLLPAPGQAVDVAFHVEALPEPALQGDAPVIFMVFSGSDDNLGNDLLIAPSLASLPGCALDLPIAFFG
jgi:hypothetical protein